ncbi:hypothetical protein FF38_00404 [Lucilia cuprina]|uniref:Uncharacterized protein n=1 Tax=Lucilia cuprina TaxID=7375 RepID=A0A0L0BKI2_LUCCU|nr:hypothetical protein FF38_00404 [Lucilia cuprina]
MFHAQHIKIVSYFKILLTSQPANHLLVYKYCLAVPHLKLFINIRFNIDWYLKNFPWQYSRFRAENQKDNTLSSTFSGNEVPMGYTVSNQAEGKYFMEIGTNAPYGINGNKHDLLMFEKSGTCKETDIVKLII